MDNETRKLPTRAGWYWYHDPSSPHGVCVYVGKSTITGQMILDTTDGIMAVDEIAGEWIAPIPAPAVLVALAEYTRQANAHDLTPMADYAAFAASLTALRAAIRASAPEAE